MKKQMIFKKLLSLFVVSCTILSLMGVEFAESQPTLRSEDSLTVQYDEISTPTWTSTPTSTPTDTPTSTPTQVYTQIPTPTNTPTNTLIATSTPNYTGLTISPNVPITGITSSSTEVHVYRYIATTNINMAITVSHTNCTKVVFTDVYGSNLATNENHGSGSFALEYKVTAGTTYYIKISAADSGSINYTLTLTELIDDFGDTMDKAMPIELNKQLDGNLVTSNDIDYLSFCPTQTALYKIDKLAGNTNLLLQDSIGNNITLNNYGTNEYYSALKANQVYYLKVTRGYYTVYSYSIKVSGPIIDDYDDTPSTAKNIDIGNLIEGAVNYYGDIDVFSFTPVKEGIYYIANTGLMNQNISLYDCNYNLVSTYSLNNDNNKLYYYNLDLNKPYYIIVGGNISAKDYSLMVRGPIVDDFGNTINTGNIIKLNSSTNGKIDYAGDKDVFVFVPSTSVPYYIRTKSDSGLSVKVFDRYGTQIYSQISFDSKERVLKCDLAANNRYSIQIEHYDSFSTGSYSLSVSDTAFFMIKGYIKPDVTLTEPTAPVLNSGFKVEIMGTSLSAVTDQNGYFEITNVQENSIGVTIKISKDNYLFRQIKNVIITSDKEIATASAPIEMWAGDILQNETQDNAINISDVMQIAKIFGKTLGNEGFNKNCDLNLDNAINIEDIMILAKHYNKISDNYPTL